jgi:ATP-dependent Lhr-like helicase
VREEAWPEVGHADELHDALLIMGCLPEGEGERWRRFFDELVGAGRAGALDVTPRLWIAAERLPMLAATYPGASCTPALVAPERDQAKP